MNEEQSLSYKIAEQLHSTIEGMDSAFLPSVTELSARFVVSRSVMAKAIRILAARGVLVLHERRRAQIAGRVPSQTYQKVKATERLYTELHDAITSGRLKLGTPLPKISVFVLRDHMSNKSVQVVYERLIGANVVHRKGKSFIAGPQPTRSQSVGVLSRPVILIVTRSSSAWTRHCKDERTEQFGRTFIQEAESASVRLLEFCLQRIPEHLPLNEREEALSAHVREYGDNYLGSLVEGNRKEIPDIEEWAQTLSLHGKPVVWFDKNDNGLQEDRKLRHFVRCHYSEQEVVDAALDFLWLNGHRVVGYLFKQPDGWQKERLQALQSSARRHEKQVKLLDYCMLGHIDWANGLRGRTIKELETLSTNEHPLISKAFRNMREQRTEILARLSPITGTPPCRAPLDAIIALTRARQAHVEGLPSTWDCDIGVIWSGLCLTPLLEQGITALLAPNDAICRTHHESLIANLEIAVPRALSLLSFDNAFRTSFHQLSSVDAGFGALGYQAFHSILRDIPIRPDSKGNIPVRPRVIDRGSVARMETD